MMDRCFLVAMARTPATFLLLLLVSSGLHVSCACPDSCTCRDPPLLNCSSAGLTSPPRPIRASVAQLDLSHNLLLAVAFDGPRPNLRDVWLGDNGIQRLSLCVGGGTGRTRRGRGCESWAPALQLLSVERNRLQRLPQGLESSRSLKVLQLSFNRISALRPGDLRQLRQLEELRLDHNLIWSLHPQTFQGLTQLRVLDLSFNMLTSPQPSTYFSLRNMGADVALGGNRWRCDCSARGLRRRMAYDGSRGLRAWALVCASPALLSGRDLLQLQDNDLDCSSGGGGGTELHRDVTVHRGSEILLACAGQDLSWWIPGGEASVSQPQGGLLISDIKETDTGLYVCVSEKLEVVSVFNLQISEVEGARRKARSLPGISEQMTVDTSDQGRNQLIRATQTELDLAVCLSVFITFVIAFILGVLARPCVDALLRRFTEKKSSSATTSVSAVDQRQYDNEAYCHGEEPEFLEPHRERRVTFSTIDYTEEGHVTYYDTVNAGHQERVNDAVIECEPAERDTNTAGGSGTKISMRESSAEDSQRDISHEKGFEHIPDSVERRGSVSSRSDSSQSDKVINSTPTCRQREEDSVQQRAGSSTAAQVEVAHTSLEGPSGLPGFPTEPFADWSPHAKNTNLSDPGLWQENEEPFEFSDSARSTSARSSSVRGSFDGSQLVSTLNKQKSVDSSSSSSNVSEDEHTRYTVNQVEEDSERNLRKDGNFEQRTPDDAAIRSSVQLNQGDYRYATQRPAVRARESFSSLSSDGEGLTVKKGRVPRLVATGHDESLNTSEPSSPAGHRSSSSSESAAKHKHDLIKPIKRRAPPPPTCSYSRVEGEDKTKNHMQKQGEKRLPIGVSQTGHPDTKWPVLDLGATTRIKRRLDIKGPSPDSSSSDSEDETTRYTERPGKMETAGPPVLVSQTGSHNPDSRWPVLDLEHIPHIKRRLDVKRPSPDLSSSSDNDQIKKQSKGEMFMAKLPSKVSQTVSYNQQTKWPVLDLRATTRIKRRLDFKGPLPDSSSSSGSEDETTSYTERPGKVEIAGPTFQESYTERHDSDTRWPVLDLEVSRRIKRRLDIKPSSPTLDSLSSRGSMNHKMSSQHSSSSSDEQDGNVKNGRYPQTTVDPDFRWPDLELSSAFHVQRRLDIKACSPPPESSSSSDHESEARSTNVEKRRTDVRITGYQPGQGLSGTNASVPRVKKRLNIKGPSQPKDSGSTFSGEDEHAKGLEPSPKTQVIGTSRSPKTDHSIQLENYKVITEEMGDINATPEINPELWSRWATMNLGVSRFRKRIQITANTREPPSPSSLAPPDSSSMWSGTQSKSSRTQDNGKGSGVQGITYKESTIIPKDKAEKVFLGLKGRGDNCGDVVEVTEKSTKDDTRPTTERKPDTLFTGFGIPHVKRYLDIKVNEKVPPLEQLRDSSSSSSENEDASTKPAGEGWRKEAGQNPTSLYSIQDVTVKPSQTELGQREDEAELEIKTDSERPQWSLANIPRVRRALDIRAQRESRTSENEMMSRSVPDLSLGVPRVKRRLNVKGPLPSSSSESESDSASNMSAMTDNDFLITYKRVIMKTSSLPGWSSSQNGGRETERVAQEGASFAPKTVPRLAFDDVVDRRTWRPRGGADVPAEIRWTGIGRHMPDLSVPSPTGRSSLVSRDVSLSPARGFEKLDAPSAGNERRGLGALKAMSSERRMWDATEDNLSKGAAPRWNDTRFENRSSEGEVKSSTSTALNMLYGVPLYRRHDLEGTGPPREAPPPVPTTLSPP